MIQIPEQKIIEAAEKNMDEFLKVFTDAYLDAVGGEITAENMNKLNGYQHTLLAFRFFTDEVGEGGFVQLIQNGYGGYVFDNPTAKSLKLMGAKSLSKIKVTLPSIEEQNSIAEVLTNIDKEIDIVKERLAAIRTQKNGLMHRLLTGKTRRII